MAAASSPETARHMDDASILRMPLVFVTLGSVSSVALSLWGLSVASTLTVLASKVISC